MIHISVRYKLLLISSSHNCQPSDKMHSTCAHVQGSKKMVIAALALSLRRAARLTPTSEDASGIKLTLLVILCCYAERN